MLPDVATCEMGEPTQSIPADGAVDVPIDAQPKIAMEPCAGSSPVVRAELVDAAGTVYASIELTDETVGFVSLAPQADLPANTTFAIHLDNDPQPQRVFGFTTGDRLSEPIAGEPTAEVEATSLNGDGAFEYDYRITPAADPEDGSLIVVRSGDAAGSFRVNGTEPIHDGFFSPDGDNCIDVEQIGLNGQSVSIEACDRGCSTLGRPVGGLSGFAFALLFVRRRRFTENGG